MAEKDEEKKIIIDEDWKQQAQKEKEELAKEAENQEQAQDERQLPEADFSGLVSMLTTQAFFAMGLIKTEQDQEPQIDLAMAKFNIDMLGTIEEKTKGNITDDENKLLQGALHQLRITYVKLSGQEE